MGNTTRGGLVGNLEGSGALARCTVKTKGVVCGNFIDKYLRNFGDNLFVSIVQLEI